MTIFTIQHMKRMICTANKHCHLPEVSDCVEQGVLSEDVGGSCWVGIHLELKEVCGVKGGLWSWRRFVELKEVCGVGGGLWS